MLGLHLKRQQTFKLFVLAGSTLQRKFKQLVGGASTFTARADLIRDISSNSDMTEHKE